MTVTIKDANNGKQETRGAERQIDLEYQRESEEQTHYCVLYLTPGENAEESSV